MLAHSPLPGTPGDPDPRPHALRRLPIRAASRALLLGALVCVPGRALPQTSGSATAIPHSENVRTDSTSKANSPAGAIGRFVIGDVTITAERDSTRTRAHRLHRARNEHSASLDVDFNRVDGWSISASQRPGARGPLAPDIRAVETYTFGRHRLLGSVSVLQPVLP